MCCPAAVLFSEVVGVLSVGYAPHEALLVHGGASTARANCGAGALLRFFDSRLTSHSWLHDDGACGERAVFGHGVGGDAELLGYSVGAQSCTQLLGDFSL